MRRDERVFTREKRKGKNSLSAPFLDGPPPVGGQLRRFLQLLLLHEELLQSRQPRQRLLPGPLLHPVVEEHALKVVVLVQEDAPGPAAERSLELGAVEALGLDLDDGRPLRIFFVFFWIVYLVLFRWVFSESRF